MVRFTAPLRGFAFGAVVLAINAAITFAVLPLVTHALGTNYRGDLFADQYDLIAENLLNGHGYRIYPETSLTMLRSPGYVIILLGIFLLFGKSLLAVQILQFAMSGVTGFIVYLIARHLRLTQAVSKVAAVIYLFHPVTLLSETRGGTDTFLTMCYTSTLWLFLEALARRHAWRFVVAGMMLGVTMLVKASVALTLPAIYLFLVLRPRHHHTRPGVLTRDFALIAVTAALVMSPWIIRNYAVSGKFVPTMTQGGLAMFQGMELVKQADSDKDSKDILEDADRQQLQIGEEMHLRMKPDFFPQFYDIHDEIDYYSELGHKAWETYKAEPRLLVRAIAHNSWAFWLQGRTEKATMMNATFMLPFLTLVLLGSVVILRRNPEAWIVAISVISFILPHLIIIAVARYCSAVIPLLSIPAAVVVTSYASRIFGTRLPPGTQNV